MPRSFEIVERKLFESDYFLDALKGTRSIVEAEFLLSAFLSASRAVTFALQASLGDNPEFPSWYEPERHRLKEVGGWFVEARNASQKEGAYFIRSSSSRPNGACLFYTEPLFPMDKAGVLPTSRPRAAQAIGEGILNILLRDAVGATTPEPTSPDVASMCEKYLRALVGVVFRCFQRFGMDIDPQQYYSARNLERLGKTIEDFEEELGFPRGWTAGIPHDHRLRVLRSEAGCSEVDHLFEKYGVGRLR
jgi:hypothetical protein